MRKILGSLLRYKKIKSEISLPICSEVENRILTEEIKKLTPDKLLEVVNAWDEFCQKEKSRELEETKILIEALTKKQN